MEFVLTFQQAAFEEIVVYNDVKVFNPHAPSNPSTNAKSIYRRHKLGKKYSYEARIREVEQSSFTPLIGDSTGG